MKKILVVDDEESIRFIYKEEFEEEGFTVELAKDGFEALEKLFFFQPDLVTLDIKMPFMDGIETLKRIREWDRKIPIVLVSAYGEYKQDQTTWASNAYIVKCADLTELKRVVRKFLSEKSIVKKTLRYSINKDTIRIISSLYREIGRLTAENSGLHWKLEKLLKEKSKQTGSSKEKDITEYEDTDLQRSVLGITAHSLKTEFFHIGSSVKYLRKLVKDSLNIEEECAIIERSIHYSQLILRRLLDFLDLGKPPLMPVKVMGLTRRTEELIRPRLKSGIQLQVTSGYGINENTVVFGNIEQLMEILLELINNSVNALYERTGTIEIKVEQKDNDIAISVRDNGPGIPEAYRQDIFKRQVPSVSGLGLGLFLCNKVVNEMKGKLIYQTSSNQGTTFTILLPTDGSHKMEDCHGNKNSSRGRQP
jgi:signal transduction histidine kinase